LDEDEAARYWLDVLRVARALARHYQPLKMNYETLGNTVPHLHTHLLPRFVQDPAPGRPFPLLPQTGEESKVDDDLLRSDALALRALLKP
jgi:diadenosine tetraphosphate (Ap4A) HIT family hydrolase